MKTQNKYLLVGVAWMACCIYQYKNNNMFMAAASAIISVLFLAMVIYKNKESKH